ncbi:MAG: ribbon-helix-helix protein, CopG family [Actinobacteria bacterium]|nr:ribbon-helix-helix protein, CopG family [Actinomycetota bacterium]
MLFSAAQYAALEVEARSQELSVGAFIREAVAERLDRQAASGNAEVWTRIFARADALPPGGPIDWDEEKAAFDQDILREVQIPIRRAS